MQQCFFLKPYLDTGSGFETAKTAPWQSEDCTSENLSVTLIRSQRQGNSLEYSTQPVEDKLTWILGVVSKQLRLLHGRVGDSTTSVNSLSPQMSELVEDAVAS